MDWRRIGICLATSAAAFAVFGLPAAALADHVSSSGPKVKRGGTRLVMPQMDAVRGKQLFVDKGCVACHAVNGVGGHDAPPMDAHDMPASMNPFDFAAKMWNHAPGMLAAQEGAFGEQILFNGDELADIIAFVHDDEVQHRFSESDLTEEARRKMAHDHGAATGTKAHAAEIGHHHHGDDHGDAHGQGATREVTRVARVATGHRHSHSQLAAYEAPCRATAGGLFAPATCVTVGEVLAKVRAAGYANIHAIEFDNGRYEVEAYNARNHKVLLLIDPRTAEIRSQRFVTHRMAGASLPFSTIVAKVKAAGFDSVHFVDRENSLYEVHARDAKGRMIEVFVHPKTGEVLKHPKTGKPLWKYVPEHMPIEQQLTAQEVAAKVEKAGYRDVFSVTQELTFYEVGAHDAQGARVTVYVDPKTGKVLPHP